MKKLKNILTENYLFDSHVHLPDGDNLNEVLSSAENIGVRYVCDMSVDCDDAERVINRAGKQAMILPSAGIHPQKCVEGTDVYSLDYSSIENIEFQLERFENLVRVNKEKLFMVGEIGLDYYTPPGKNLVSQSTSLSKSGQKRLFEGALEISVCNNLPVSVHIREAFDDAFPILKSIKNDDEIVILHSFTGTYEQLKKAVDNSYYIGVNGIITYKSAQNLRENLQKFLGKMHSTEPIDFYNKHIVFETDAPWLNPSTSITRFNEPQNVVKVYEFVKNIVG